MKYQLLKKATLLLKCLNIPTIKCVDTDATGGKIF